MGLPREQLGRSSETRGPFLLVMSLSNPYLHKKHPGHETNAHLSVADINGVLGKAKIETLAGATD